MSLNWTPEAIIDLIIGSIFIIGSARLMITAQSKKVKSLKYFYVSWIFASLFFFLEAISFLYLNTTLAKVATIMNILTVFFLVLGIDYTLHEKVRAIRMSVVCFIGGVEIVLAFDQNSIVESTKFGVPTLIWTGLFDIASTSVMSLYIIFLLYWAFITWRNAPPQLKKISFYTIVCIIIMGIITAIFFFISATYPEFVLFGKIALLIGVIVLVFFAIIKPKIFYILPFKAYKLLIVHKKSGVPLFYHQWFATELNEDLLSGLISAFQKMSKTILTESEITGVNLTQGKLTFDQTDNVVAGLISSKSSQFLKRSLKQFTNEFERIHKKELINTVSDTSKFSDATALIDKYFPNLPSSNR